MGVVVLEGQVSWTACNRLLVELHLAEARKGVGQGTPLSVGVPRLTCRADVLLWRPTPVSLCNTILHYLILPLLYCG